IVKLFPHQERSWKETALFSRWGQFMVRFARRSTAILGLLVTLAGCTHSSKQCLCGRPAGAADLCAAGLPVVERCDLAGDLQGPPLPVPPLDALGRLRPAVPYQQLAALECQCHAARAATPADLLQPAQAAVAEEAAAAGQCHSDQAERQAKFKQTILAYLALEDRNRTAAQALDAYYRLGEAEASWDLVQQALTRVGDALTKARDLKARGLAVPVD